MGRAFLAGSSSSRSILNLQKHLFTACRFPKRVQLWDRSGALVREMASLPLAEDIPIATNSCRKGPRAIGWRDDKEAELTWIECQDGGDPAVQVPPDCSGSLIQMFGCIWCLFHLPS